MGVKPETVRIPIELEIFARKAPDISWYKAIKEYLRFQALTKDHTIIYCVKPPNFVGEILGYHMNLNVPKPRERKKLKTRPRRKSSRRRR